MVEEIYVDLEILAREGEDGYVVRISKSDLHTLVTFDPQLIVRHWNGDKPVRLEPYGKNAIRTQEDASEDNNLTRLPRFDLKD